MKGWTVGLLAAACALVAYPAVASGDSATHTFLLVMEVPNVAQAPNGDRVAITGEGEFQVHPKAVEAEGEFTHTDAAGTVIASGTWTATKLLAYQSYGCGVVEGDPLPPNFCGGKLKMRVVLTPEGTSLQIPAILTVFCIIGPNPPNSHDDESGEGITLVVPGINNFNKLVSGMNIYIQTS
jgi:hypothetical protein